jgi:hypothetical protein
MVSVGSSKGELKSSNGDASMTKGSAFVVVAVVIVGTLGGGGVAEGEGRRLGLACWLGFSSARGIKNVPLSGIMGPVIAKRTSLP